MSDTPEHESSCSRHPPVGDHGQRFEVRATRCATGQQMVIGWTDREDGGSLAKGARLWWAVRDVVVIDRKAST